MSAVTPPGFTLTVNGRFTRQQVTGVQRYAHELVSRIAGERDWRVRLLVPPDDVVELAPGERTPHEPDERWSGGRGHLWEQVQLPGLHRRAGGNLLLSPTGWGPLVVRSQLLVTHDLHPITHPQYFAPGYARWTRVASPALAHVPRRVGATSEHVADQVVRHLRVRRDRIDIVPPAVGPPFTDRPLGDLGTRDAGYCLFVQGDKEQKNLAFVLSLWPEVHRALGLELVVTERPVGTRLGREHTDPPGVRRLQDPTDAELVELYEGALCLLWPSHAEGFGIPLLEAMAVGTPFLAAAVGAAEELAVDPCQVLPLEPAAWVDQLTTWASSDLTTLRERCAAAGRAATWARSASLLVAAIERSAR